MLNAGHAPKHATPSPWLDNTYFQNTLATNLMGVINGISTFLPLLQKSEGPSAIVLTGSKQGITNPPGNPAYNCSKSAVKTLAEHLSHDLRTESNPIYSPHTSVHLLIPGWTFTGLSGNKGPTSSEAAMQKKPPVPGCRNSARSTALTGSKQGSSTWCVRTTMWMKRWIKRG